MATGGLDNPCGHRSGIGAGPVDIDAGGREGRGIAMPPWADLTTSPRAAPRRRRRDAIALALALAVVLVAAPMRAALRPACDLCPPDCPMHQARAQGSKLGCHDGARSAKPKCHNTLGAQQQHDAESGQPRLSKPPCGNHGTVPGLALAPMALPTVSAWVDVPEVDSPAHRRPDAPRRGGDPPDTPPPIRLA